MEYAQTAWKAIKMGAVGSLIYYILHSLSKQFFPSRIRRYHHGKPGSTWALVTGGSDGIGRGFVDNLLAQGFNVLIHGRNSEKLDRIRKEHFTQYPNLSIRTVVSDASSTTPDIDALSTAATSLPGPLTVLINNVGGTPPGSDFSTVDSQSQSYIDSLISMNLRFPTQLTRALLPILKTNNPSLIINIGSVAGELPMPYVTTYGACKSFNNHFSRALKAEMRAEGLAEHVEVLGVLVAKVISASTKENPVDWFTATSDQLAKAALAKVGCGKPLVWAWWRHWVQSLALAVVPEALLERILVGVMSEQREDERKRQAKTK